MGNLDLKRRVGNLDRLRRRRGILLQRADPDPVPQKVHLWERIRKTESNRCPAWTQKAIQTAVSKAQRLGTTPVPSEG